LAEAKKKKKTINFDNLFFLLLKLAEQMDTNIWFYGTYK